MKTFLAFKTSLAVAIRLTRFLVNNTRYDMICHTHLAGTNSACIIQGINDSIDRIVRARILSLRTIICFRLFNLSYNRVNGKGETSCLSMPICALPVHLATKKTTVSNVANGVEVQNISRVFAVAAAAPTAV